jgi:hypothetical protein
MVVLVMQVPDGLMVSGTSAIFSKNPSPGSPRAGAFLYSQNRRGVGFGCLIPSATPGRLPLDSRETG